MTTILADLLGEYTRRIRGGSATLPDAPAFLPDEGTTPKVVPRSATLAELLAIAKRMAAAGELLAPEEEALIIAALMADRELIQTCERELEHQAIHAAYPGRRDRGEARP